MPNTLGWQLPLLENSYSERVINVASVPLRSPFRYAGGKTWLVPYIRQWLSSLRVQPSEFIEPFAGGAIIGLTVAVEQLADHVTLIELDEDVAAVWQTILYGNAGWLADRIATFDLTAKSVEQVLAEQATTLQERAFQTILRNRVNRGGILAPGAGKLKYGENGKGLASRWYPHTLRERILNIVRIRERLTFIQGDGLEAMRQFTARRDAVLFLDPPYTAAGKKAGTRLYTHHQIEHQELFRIVRDAPCDFMMTYDDTEEVRELAAQHHFQVQAVTMKNTHHSMMKELLIGRRFDWLSGSARGSSSEEVDVSLPDQ